MLYVFNTIEKLTLDKTQLWTCLTKPNNKLKNICKNIKLYGTQKGKICNVWHPIKNYRHEKLENTAWMRNILVLCCFCNNLWQTQWLKITQVYYFTVLKIRSLHWVIRAAFFLEAQRGNVFLCLFQVLEALHISWFIAPHYTYLHLYPNISLTFILIFLSPSYKNPSDYIWPTQTAHVQNADMDIFGEGH